MIPDGWTLKETRRWMAAEASRYGSDFVELAPERRPKPDFIRAMRNRHYLVQLYEPGPEAPHIVCRISINRAVLDDKGGWLDGITWEQLQAVKAGVGFGGHDAIEVYPRDGDVVNVANIRHLWVLREPLPWAWGDGRAK
jgi:hypothetical protein